MFQRFSGKAKARHRADNQDNQHQELLYSVIHDLRPEEPRKEKRRP
jgi:hypothetical protein